MNKLVIILIHLYIENKFRALSLYTIQDTETLVRSLSYGDFSSEEWTEENSIGLKISR